MAGKNNRKHNNNRNSHANTRYKAEGRQEKNKKRNMATEERRQLRDLELREYRGHLRKIGALRRIDRRIKKAHDAGNSTLRLEGIRANVAAAAGV